MEYISVKGAAEDWGLTPRMVIYHCKNGHIEGALKIEGIWLIPGNAIRPEDMRKGNGRKPSVDKKARKGEL